MKQTRHLTALSIVCAITLAGCGREQPAPSVAVPAAQPTAESGHAHKAPHGGALVALGDHFAHVEVVLDATTGKLTAYALDGHADEPVRLKQESLEIVAKAPAGSATTAPLTTRLMAIPNKLTGETLGDTSQFEATVPELRGVKTFDASIRRIEIKGRTLEAVEFNYPNGNEHD